MGQSWFSQHDEQSAKIWVDLKRYDSNSNDWNQKD